MHPTLICFDSYVGGILALLCNFGMSVREMGECFPEQIPCRPGAFLYTADHWWTFWYAVHVMCMSALTEQTCCGGWMLPAAIYCVLSVYEELISDSLSLDDEDFKVTTTFEATTTTTKPRRNTLGPDTQLYTGKSPLWCAYLNCPTALSLAVKCVCFVYQ